MLLDHPFLFSSFGQRMGLTDSQNRTKSGIDPVQEKFANTCRNQWSMVKLVTPAAFKPRIEAQVCLKVNVCPILKEETGERFPTTHSGKVERVLQDGFLPSFVT
jgi:hypothetical protein